MQLPQLPPGKAAVNARFVDDKTHPHKMLVFDIVDTSHERKHVPVGDAIEWCCGALLTVGAYFATHLGWPPMFVGGLFLGYEAQCYAGHKMFLPKLPKLRLPRRRHKDAQ